MTGNRIRLAIGIVLIVLAVGGFFLAHLDPVAAVGFGITGVGFLTE